MQKSRLNHVNESLLKRDLIRSSVLRTSGYSVEDFNSSHDIEYVPRDRGEVSVQMNRAFRISSFIYRDSCQMEFPLSDSALKEI